MWNFMFVAASCCATDYHSLHDKVAQSDAFFISVPVGPHSPQSPPRFYDNSQSIQKYQERVFFNFLNMPSLPM